MITPEDLLGLATFDLRLIPSEAAARRAISTSYYAAFHAIASAGAGQFDGTDLLRQRLARSYDHGAVKAMAGEMERIGRQSGAGSALAIIGRNLLKLREARERADYDLLLDLTWSDSAEAISLAVETLHHIARLQDDPAFAELVLLPLLRDRNRRG